MGRTAWGEQLDEVLNADDPRPIADMKAEDEYEEGIAQIERARGVTGRSSWLRNAIREKILRGGRGLFEATEREPPGPARVPDESGTKGAVQRW